MTNIDQTIEVVEEKESTPTPVEEEEVVEKVVKKKRKPIDPERKKQMLENLAKGRAKRKAQLEEAKARGDPPPKRKPKETKKMILEVKTDPKVINELKEDDSNQTIKSDLEQLKNEMKELRKDKNPENKEENKETIEGLKTQIQELKLQLKNSKKSKPIQDQEKIIEAKPEPVPVPKKISQNLYTGSIWSRFKN